jgi:L-alanine-DL-glutamate epimerase-like enolase superfamily enzyme
MNATKWGYSEFGPETEKVQSFTRIKTDDGLEGYSESELPFYFYARNQDEIEDLVKPLLIVVDPLDHERLSKNGSMN